MKAYQTARAIAEGHLAKTALPATILRPFYVLGPGHRWPMALVPVYALLERLPRTRTSALRLGLVTIDQMVAALVWAVDYPARGDALLHRAGHSQSEAVRRKRGRDAFRKQSS